MVGVADRQRVQAAVAPLYLHLDRLRARTVLVEVTRRERELGLVGHEHFVLTPTVNERERVDVVYRARVDVDDDAGEGLDVTARTTVVGATRDDEHRHDHRSGGA